MHGSKWRREETGTSRASTSRTEPGASRRPDREAGCRRDTGSHAERYKSHDGNPTLDPDLRKPVIACADLVRAPYPRWPSQAENTFSGMCHSFCGRSAVRPCVLGFSR
jgi:hypothetical protein